MSSQFDQMKVLTRFNRGIVFLGPDIFLPSLNYSQLDAFESIKETLTDSTGWDSCDEDKQLTLAITELGLSGVVEKLAQSFPYLDVKGEANELDKVFSSYRPSYIVDLNYHNAVDSFLIRQNHMLKRVISDADIFQNIERRMTPTCFKLRGDLWLENPSLTLEQLEKNLSANPLIEQCINSLIRDEPVILIGIDPKSNLFNWIRSKFLGDVSLVISCFVSSNRNWKKYCQGLGDLTICAPTRTELIQKLSEFFEEPRDEQQPDLITAIEAIARDSKKRFKVLDQFEWLDEARSGNRQEIREANEKIIQNRLSWISLHQRNLIVDPEPLCRSIAFQTRSGFSSDAQFTLDTTLDLISNWPLEREGCLASIGCSLMRMDDDWRGFIALRQALFSGKLYSGEQSDCLAWVLKAVLARIEELMMRGHVRAATEQIAQFLNAFASLLAISSEDATDEESKWSLYYINLRLGRIMMLASSMAGQSNQVYAQQAVALLLRTVEFVPEKPDGYKYLRPMLTDAASPTFDLNRWNRLLDLAPSQIQKKLGGEPTGL